ncbi:hypothetical protein LEP1GSC046_3858 [Leptospira kirschneri serovar Bim str. 1051]|uniref:Uncharacterized protein n=1 Tax=Leptospira kirschneri serovar Bulgarica str. Nikolaevo TaxID=1240687 RepID=M6EYH0_9LEPT|nr:hypothetical protein LEP1GSC122_3258 [Leptospira kirschneri serovar Valbuzzi str. 200702274]EMJ91584.1 hypothetical protein LEP1GSC198_1784 [Leptospira kirschneri str. JB]EMK21513.1 hypothetical protein LEP1GSC008_4355 [Leptospira kirschneri serovar Bulgarica str. Nikolaevo]EMN04267.1 hypothetical protein LEP1GSC046_3858 [Leptospira kirschneri serovar Bim str. 1051]EMO79814.1 hypothetical protein LEP1GSC126_0758 [Leptospira kirschneri str. 200801774]
MAPIPEESKYASPEKSRMISVKPSPCFLIINSLRAKAFLRLILPWILMVQVVSWVRISVLKFSTSILLGISLNRIRLIY